MPSRIHHKLEAGEVKRSGAGKWAAIVDANDSRQAAPLKESDHDSAHTEVALLGDEADTKQVATGQIADGERIAALAVGGAPPTLEIDGPDVVGQLRNSQSERFDLRPAMAAAWARRNAQICRFEPTAHGAQRGQFAGTQMSVLKADTQLFDAPTRVPLTQSDYLAAPLGAKLLRVASRRTRLVAKSRSATRSIPSQPLVGRRCANAELTAESPHIGLRAQGRGDKIETFSMGGYVPGHPRIKPEKPRARLNLDHPLPAQSVLVRFAHSLCRSAPKLLLSPHQNRLFLKLSMALGTSQKAKPSGNKV